MSLSLQDLVARLDEVRLLAAEDPVRQGNLSAAPLSNAINRACVVLLSAHLEGFLEDLVTEALDALVRLGASVEQLPVLLRAVHAEEHLRPLEPVKDRNSRAAKIERLFAQEGDLWTAGSVLQASMMRSSAVCREMANPGSKEIRQFLEFVGVDIGQHLQAAGQQALLSQTNSLVAKRNAIAHGETSAAATPTDIDDYVRLLVDLGREVDQAVALAVQNTCAAATTPWPV